MSHDFSKFKQALEALDAYVELVHAAVYKRTVRDGKLDPSLADTEQRVMHGYAWVSSTATALHALLEWAETLNAANKLTEVETLTLDIGFAEYLSQISSGVAMGQNEVVRPYEFNLTKEAAEFALTPAVTDCINTGCLLYTSPSPRDRQKSRMPSSA